MDYAAIRSRASYRITNMQYISNLWLALLIVGTTAMASPPPRVPALSVTAPNGESSILIGTVHVAIAGLLEPDASIFKDARRFVIEHNSIPQSGDRGTASGAERALWAKKLSDEEVSIYLQRTRCAHVADADALSYLARPSVQVANAGRERECNVGGECDGSPEPEAAGQKQRGREAGESKHEYFSQRVSCNQRPGPGSGYLRVPIHLALRT